MAGVLFDKPCISRGNPSFRVFGFCRAFGIFVILYKSTGRTVINFAIFTDANLSIRCRNTYRVRAHFTVGLNGDKNRRLRLPIKLFEVYP